MNKSIQINGYQFTELTKEEMKNIRGGFAPLVWYVVGAIVCAAAAYVGYNEAK